MSIDVKTSISNLCNQDWLQRARQIAELSTMSHSDDEAQEIVIDLSGVELMPSHELNGLIQLQISVRQKGVSLVIEHPEPIVREVFMLTRLDRLIEIR